MKSPKKDAGAKAPKKAEKKSKSGKKDKKKKDPNAPKRGLSAFLFFSGDTRNDVLKANPGIKFADVTKEIAKLWAACSDNTKKKYEDKAKKDRERYEREKASYESKKSS